MIILIESGLVCRRGVGDTRRVIVGRGFILAIVRIKRAFWAFWADGGQTDSVCVGSRWQS